MPSATEPEDTSTSSMPRARSAAICSTQSAMASRCSPRPPSVSSALPILTTQRLARVSSLRSFMRVL